MTARPQFQMRIGRDAADLEAAQRLRYAVFVEELGGTGAGVDHDLRLETDGFDPFATHMLLEDVSAPGAPVLAATTRLMNQREAEAAGRFYSESEYDLDVLKGSGRQLVELGRTCLREEYRGGEAMFHLWQGLAQHLFETGAEVLFGVASFHGTDLAAYAQPLSLLHHRHLAPPDLRPVARAPGARPMDLVEESTLDRKAALLATPALIKAYLRLGAMTGEGAFVDTAFNTTDVCLIVDLNRLSDRQKSIYTKDLQP